MTDFSFSRWSRAAALAAWIADSAWFALEPAVPWWQWLAVTVLWSLLGYVAVVADPVVWPRACHGLCVAGRVVARQPRRRSDNALVRPAADRGQVAQRHRRGTAREAEAGDDPAPGGPRGVPEADRPRPKFLLRIDACH